MKASKYSIEFKNKVCKEYLEALTSGETAIKVITARYGRKVYVNAMASWVAQYKKLHNLCETHTVETKYAKLARLYKELDTAMNNVKQLQQEIKETI